MMIAHTIMTSLSLLESAVCLRVHFAVLRYPKESNDVLLLEVGSRKMKP